MSKPNFYRFEGFCVALGIAVFFNYNGFNLTELERFVPPKAVVKKFNGWELEVADDRFDLGDSCFRSVSLKNEYEGLIGISYDCSCEFDRITYVDKNENVKMFLSDQMPYYTDEAVDEYSWHERKLKHTLGSFGLCERLQ